MKLGILALMVIVVGMGCSTAAPKRFSRIENLVAQNDSKPSEYSTVAAVQEDISRKIWVEGAGIRFVAIPMTVPFIEAQAKDASQHAMESAVEAKTRLIRDKNRFAGTCFAFIVEARKIDFAKFKFWTIKVAQGEKGELLSLNLENLDGVASVPHLMDDRSGFENYTTGCSSNKLDFSKLVILHAAPPSWSNGKKFELMWEPTNEKSVD
jgi:hypothetical protein